MARVVQQRKAPPYGLIIMLFLFLVAAGLAVYFHIENDKSKKDKEAEIEDRQKLASEGELDKPRIKELLARYETKAREGKIPETVVGQLCTHVDELTQKINGVVTTYDDAVAKTDALYKRTGFSGGLIEMVNQANDRIARARQEAGEHKTERDRALDDREKAKSSYADLLKQYEQSKTKSNAELEALNKKFGMVTGEHGQLLQEAKDTWDRIRKEKEQMISKQTDEINRRSTRIRELEGQVRELQDKIIRTRKAADVVTKPDGKILEVTEDGFCFIDLGGTDGVEVGFSFAVYPATGIPEDGANKGSILVASVADHVSRCRVVQQDKTHPVIKDDLVANVAFDSIRKWRFVVEGEFDLHGTGEPTPEGAAETKLLLKRLGADVTPKVDIDVDFVVLGTEPPPPQKPEDDAPPHVWEAYRGRVKVRKRYSEVKSAAQSLRIPIRNQNWLLDTTGYIPITPLRDVTMP